MPGRHKGAASRISKYQPVADFLAAQEADTVRLTFAQIEELIGSPLPDSAYVSASHWRQKRWPADRTWTAAGWEAVQLDRRGQAVVFTRTAAKSE